MLLMALVAASISHAAQTQSSFTEDAERRVMTLTNAVRKENGLQPLQTDGRLTEAARYFAGYVAKTDKLEHDADGSAPADRAKMHGYSYCIIAENLASEYSSAGFTPERLAGNFVEGWSKSPTHRANMLEPEVTQIGVGIAAGTQSGEYYAVQMFGRPMSQMVRFRVTNRSTQTIRYEYRKRTVALAPKQIRSHESCVAGELKFEWPRQQQPSAVRPKDGDRVTIVEAGPGTYKVIQE
jgi:uncharacterized protein YkwD